MIIETKDATVTSNITALKKRQVGVSARAMRHIMGILTNLYNDRELAVIREYYTNGLDAHKKAGVTAPVKITLPTWDKPNYIVQDFGVGMDGDMLFEIYGEYGESVGSDNDEIVGGFGLGSKSAYTIANQFTVSSIKDGTRTTALFQKESHGAYDVQIISVTKTTDGNGTTVNIPINTKDLNVFNSKAHQFFAYSAPGAVLVNGQAPKYALEQAEQLVNPKDSDMLIFVDSKGYGESYVIMGNVPYVLSESEIRRSLERLGVIASGKFVRMPKFFRVPIGSVEISPNREGLQTTDKTNDLIDSYMSFIVNDLQAIALKELDESTSLEDFFENHNRWNQIIEVPRKFKGEDVPTQLHLKDASTRRIYRTNWGNSQHTETDWVRLDVNSSQLIVTGYAAENYKKVNNYLTPYMEAKDISVQTFIITDSEEILKNKWIKWSNKFSVIAGNDLIEIGRAHRKAQRQLASKLNGTAKKSKIRYPVLFVDEQEIQWVNHDEIDSKTPYLAQHNLHQNADLHEYIKTVYRNVDITLTVPEVYNKSFEMVTDAKEIILLSNTRTVKALLQRVKEATPLIDEVQESFKKFTTVITPELVKYHAVNQSYWHRFLINAGIDKLVTELKDPEIVHMVQPTKKTLDDYEHYQSVRDTYEAFRSPNLTALPPIDTSKVTTLVHLDRKYPLIGSLNVWSLKENIVKHLVKYLNIVHEESLVAASSKVA